MVTTMGPDRPEESLFQPALAGDIQGATSEFTLSIYLVEPEC
jgi:hypothetical protein